MAVVENININKLVDTTISVDTGNSDKGTQRIILATDQPIVPVGIDYNSVVVALLQELIDEQKITNRLLTKIYQ